MKTNHIQRLIFTLVATGTVAVGEIDSGGGKSGDGIIFNYSSIGEPFSTPSTNSILNYSHPGMIEVIFPVTPASISDVNTNELPDGWEILHFGTLTVDPAADTDHDGASNLMEYLAATDPKNNTSVFRPQGHYLNGIFKMPIPSVSGRTYKIWISQNLENWTLQSTLIGNNLEQVFEFRESGTTSNLASFFFRVQITIP